MSIELEEWGREGVMNLCCPNCRGNNLHQRRITVWDREEDAKQVRYTTVSDAVSTMMAENHLSSNPSDRRQGMSIVFECETCAEEHDEHELCFAQHKGFTLVFWRQTQ